MADKTILQGTLDNDIVDGDFLIYWKTASGVQRRVTRASLLGATLTGLGTIATGGFTLTVPATGTAALLGKAQTFTAAQNITSPAAATVPLTVNGASAQTAALQEWKNSAGTVLSSVSAAGLFTGVFEAVKAESGSATPGIGATFDSTTVIAAGTMWLLTVAKTGGIDSANGIGLYLVHRQGTDTDVVTVAALADLAVTCSNTTAYEVRFENTGALNWTYRYSLTRVY